MMPKATRNLIAKFLTKQASLQELDQLSQWVEDPSNKEVFIQYVKINHTIDFNMKRFGTENSKKELLKLIEQEKKTHKIRKILNFSKYAALVLIFIGIGYFLNNGPNNTMGNPIDHKTVPQVAVDNNSTGGNTHATLTLEDGSIIDLEKEKAVHTKNFQGNGEELVYDPSPTTNTEIPYNYLTIPRGLHFHIKLADGTLVWLNSESQLKYPVAFVAGKPRIVELVYGEAYFKVSPSTEHSGATFKVANTSQEIEVLGTAFNIKAYRDEAHIYTTLLEGKVEVVTATTKQTLVPNQQSKLNIAKSDISVQMVDASSEISWKNGIFSFREKPLRDIMKVVSRWYDVDVVFEKKTLESVKFRGTIDKNQTLEEVLSIMTSTTIDNYILKDKVLTIK